LFSQVRDFLLNLFFILFLKLKKRPTQRIGLYFVGFRGSILLVADHTSF